jgi:putative DNA primase/helicase
VCGIDEAQITRKTDVQAVMDVIRTVSGNTQKGVARKFKKKITVPLRARFTLTCNETPYLPDNADAMARRMLLLEFTNEAEQVDPYLLSKLEKELPGIALWAMEGLRTLHEQGSDGRPIGFVVPESMTQGLEGWREFANPVGTFFDECCEHRIGENTSATELMDACVRWCEERNLKAPSMARFYERLKFVAPADVRREKETHMNSGRPYNVITNVVLKSWAREAYLLGEK